MIWLGIIIGIFLSSVFAIVSSICDQKFASPVHRAISNLHYKPENWTKDGPYFFHKSKKIKLTGNSMYTNETQLSGTSYDDKETEYTSSQRKYFSEASGAFHRKTNERIVSDALKEVKTPAYKPKEEAKLGFFERRKINQLGEF